MNLNDEFVAEALCEIHETLIEILNCLRGEDEMAEFFSEKEFSCPCCGANKIETEVIARIDTIRSSLGVPLHINSGYRCEKHNKEVGGAKDSQHLIGKAIDVSIANMTAAKKYEFLSLALEHFNGIGVGNTFFHLDL